jgi:hypothetical protein
VATWYQTQEAANAENSVMRSYKFSATEIYLSTYIDLGMAAYAYTVLGDTITMYSASAPTGPSVGTAKFTVEGTKLTLYDGAASVQPSSATPLLDGEYYKKAD